MRNLILVHDYKKQDIADFELICSMIRNRAADIAPVIVPTRLETWHEAVEVAQHPCLTVSPMPVRRFQPPRGPLLQGYEYPKSVQYQRLRRDGFPVPDWQVIQHETRLDPDDWGPYVVVKPDLGRCGRDIKVKKTARVCAQPAQPSAGGQPDTGAVLAQRFVYTGPWASTFRVVTLFGVPLLCWHCEMNHDLPPLPGRDELGRIGGINVVSNKRSSTYRLAFDEDVLALASAAHASFPDQPLLGHDIARDADTGELFILECNPRGDTWLFSSWTGRGIQDANGIDFYSQFDGLSRAADVLIRETRARAR